MNKMAIAPKFLVNGQLPNPPQCNGPNGVFSIDCANAMFRSCLQAAPSTDRLYSSALMNPQSNCSLWRSYYETAYDAFPELMADLMAKVDQAETQFCSVYQSANECRCLQFPLQNQNQCQQQKALHGCTPDTVGKPQRCEGKEFVRESEAYVDAAFMNVSFENCMPYWCWADVCWAENGATQQLLPSWVRDGQLQCTENICINILEQDTISGVLVPAASANFWGPSTARFNLCRNNAPASPVYFPNQYQVPINVIENYPFIFYLSNPGNEYATLVLDTITGVTPENNFLSTDGLTTLTAIPNNITRFQFTIDGPLLTALYNIRSNFTETIAVRKVPQTTKDIQSPIFNYTYTVGGTETQFLQIYLDLLLLPATSNIPVPVLVQKETPTYSYVLLAVAAAIFLGAFIYWNISNESGVKFARQYRTGGMVRADIQS